MKVNRRLLPVKAHFFFFMSAMGPVLPFLPVFGKQLGVSEVVMGVITSVLPVLFLIAKPVFGFILDTFQSARKIIFLLLLCTTNVFFVLLVFIPVPDSNVVKIDTCSGLHVCSNQSSYNLVEEECWSICNKTEIQQNISYSDSDCQVICKINTDNVTYSADTEFYKGFSFWSYVILMSLGSIGFNVINSVSDAICFDMLGNGAEKKYGMQRVWGTFGFGFAALIGGYAIDLWSKKSVIKDYSPAFLFAFGCMLFDLICCLKLKLPPLPRSENILSDMGFLVRKPNIAVFLIFTVLVGICDSFIIYYLFWFLEDLAKECDMMDNIKLLEGLTIAAETLGAEVLFFMYSGKILEVLGYGHCLTLCFLAYGIRLGLLSMLINPWLVLPIELIMQGPTYALCYTTIVAYASAVSPPGTSATTQGLVAGLDDGLGYALGSLSGGYLYKTIGGNNALKVYSGIAIVCSLSHAVLYPLLREKPNTSGTSVEYKSPESAGRTVIVAS
ncbi:major facilitator superfamily domain-containing protein 6 [Lycorma delicatula]|uniref:major facilitator superfamily domain-containing protein 6 n=1 Tax=Lycorma delicatula TaxID=130591 RepID=UPI003F519666